MLANAVLGLHNADVGTGRSGWRNRCHAWRRKVTARAAAAATVMVVVVVVDHALGAFVTLRGSNEKYYSSFPVHSRKVISFRTERTASQNINIHAVVQPAVCQMRWAKAAS